jgi:hypothetical protein
VKILALEGQLLTSNDYPLLAVVAAVANTEPNGPAREWLGKIQKLEEK